MFFGRKNCSKTYVSFLQIIRNVLKSNLFVNFGTIFVVKENGMQKYFKNMCIFAELLVRK